MKIKGGLASVWWSLRPISGRGMSREESLQCRRSPPVRWVEPVVGWMGSGRRFLGVQGRRRFWLASGVGVRLLVGASPMTCQRAGVRGLTVACRVTLPPGGALGYARPAVTLAPALLVLGLVAC
jgi:hypothetical protein